VGLLSRATFDEMVIDAIDRVADRAGQGASMANHGTTQHDGTDPPGNTRRTHVTEYGIAWKQKISIDQGGNLILCRTMVLRSVYGFHLKRAQLPNQMLMINDFCSWT
jgi:hypothetical protein